MSMTGMLCDMKVTKRKVETTRRRSTREESELKCEVCRYTAPTHLVPHHLATTPPPHPHHLHSHVHGDKLKEQRPKDPDEQQSASKSDSESELDVEECTGQDYIQVSATLQSVA